MASEATEKQRSENLKQAALRAPKFTSAEQIQELVDKYFEDCTPKPLYNEYGEPIFNAKTGQPAYSPGAPATMTGLALALGFAPRTGLLKYAGKKEFTYVIVRAKARVEQYMEERLFDKEGANGAKFALQNNFKGWQESAKVAAQEAANSAVKIVCDFPRPDRVKVPDATVPVAEEPPLPVLDDAMDDPAGNGGFKDPDDGRVFV